MSPAGRSLHQRVVGSLYFLLRAAISPELELLMAPYDVKLTDDSVLNPEAPGDDELTLSEPVTVTVVPPRLIER